MMRVIALWLGLAALTFQALAPLCLAGLMAPAEDAGTFPIILCTAHGLATAHPAGANGNPSPDHSPLQDQNSCPLCSALAGASHFTVPAAAVLTVPFAWVGMGKQQLPVVPHFARAVANYISRAPPRMMVPFPI